MNWRSTAKRLPFVKWPLHEKLGLHLQELMQKSPMGLEESRFELLHLVEMMGDSAYPTEMLPELRDLPPLALPPALFAADNLLEEPFRDLRSSTQEQFRKEIPDFNSFLEILRNWNI